MIRNGAKSFSPNDSRKTRRKTKPKLPRYVILKDDPPAWYVRRGFPTENRDKRGHIIYIQVVRRCYPQTAERAKEVSDLIEREYYELAPPPIAEQTVAGFVSAFVAAKQGSVATRTHDSYEWYASKYVSDASSFGLLKLTEVTPLQVQSFYMDLQRSGVSGTMVRKLHTFLSMAFNQGVRWETVARNPCRGVILPRANETEIEVLDADEVRSFTRACFADPEELLVLAFALETGMRPGEYLSLQWKNVDLDKPTVRVERSVSFPKAGGFYYKEPKTAKSRRTIQITERLAASLRDLFVQRAQLLTNLRKEIARPLKSSHAKSTGPNYERRKTRRQVAREHLAALIEHDLVFPSKSGTPISPHNLGVRHMVKACKAAKLPHHSIYSLRHSMATLALANGAKIKAVSEKLGHSDIKITLETYAHVLPMMKDEVVDVLEAALY